MSLAHATIIPFTPKPSGGSLSDRAMLVRLSISQWSTRATDQIATDEVTTAKRASPDAAQVRKRLLSKEAIAPITAAVSEARTYHAAHTLPWLDDGQRILTTANYVRYSDKMATLHDEFHTAVRWFKSRYEDAIAAARHELGELFCADDYPPVDAIAERFSFTVKHQPLPDAGDFRANIDETEVAKIRSTIERDTNNAIAAAMRSVWQRIHTAVSHMVDRLDSYDVDPVTGKKTSPFRDTLVTNIRELAEILPSLNLTQDPALDRMREQLIRHLCPHAPDALRESDATRHQVAQAARDILTQMEGYC